MRSSLVFGRSSTTHEWRSWRCPWCAARNEMSRQSTFQQSSAPAQCCYYRSLRSSRLSEAVRLTDRANMRMLIDKQAACGERFAVDLQQIELLYLVFEHAERSAGSQALGLFQ